MAHSTSKKKMQRSLKSPKSLTPTAYHLWRIREALGDYTQGRLGAELGVKQSTVAKWENDEHPESKSGSKTKGRTHEPSAEILIKFADLLARLGDSYEEDCIWLLDMARVYSNDAILGVLEHRLSQRIEPRPARPGEISKVPLIEVSAEKPALEGRGGAATCDVPAWLVPDPASIICARLSWGLFPFESGALVVINRWAGDVWELVEQGALAVVHFTRYPARIGLGLSQHEVQRAPTKVELAWLEKQGSIERQLREQDGSPEARKAFESQVAFEAELSKRWTPDERGTILFQNIQAGWLRLELANHPDFSADTPRADWPQPDDGPWRLVLQGASVAGVTRGRGAAVPLTAWDKSDWQARPPVPLVDSRILGRVISWMSPAPAHEASPIGAKSRKEPR